MSHATVSDETNYGLKAWVVVFAAALFFFYEFIQMNMFNALDPYLMRSFHIGAEQLGQLSAYYFYGDVLLIFVAGLILDRLSSRWVISLAMAACVLFTLLFSQTDTYWQAALCRFCTGMAAAFVLVGSVRVASRWFPPKRMALVVGLVVTMAMLGGMLAQAPMTYLADSLGWRHAVLIDGGIGIVLLVIIIAFVRDHPSDAVQEAAVEKAHHMPLGQGIRLAAKNSQTWLAGLYTNFMNLPIMLLGVVWGVMYLVNVDHLDRPHAALVTSMIYFGTIIGSPTVGWLSDTLRKRKLPMIVGSLFALLLILLVMYLPHLDFRVLMGLFFLLGFVTSSQVISYPLVAESNPLTITGTAEGLTSTLVMTGGFLQPLFGVLLQHGWHHHMVHGVPVYSMSNYAHAMWIMPIAFVGSFILSLFIKETGCRHYQTTQ